MECSTSTDGDTRDAVVEVFNASAQGGAVLICEHAANAIPAEFGDLGLDDAARVSHIAWDPGALSVARHMAKRLDAPLIAQRVSRLLYDCNRPPNAASAIAAVSEAYAVQGNANLSPQERWARIERFYVPFRETLQACLDERRARARPTALVTIHSFTPIYLGTAREVELGILHDADTRLADALLDAFRGEHDLAVRRNAPYGPEDGVTHTLREHALPRGLLNVMIEIRNDLIADEAGQRAMAGRLSRRLEQALAALVLTGEVPGRESGEPSLTARGAT